MSSEMSAKYYVKPRENEPIEESKEAEIPPVVIEAVRGRVNIKIVVNNEEIYSAILSKGDTTVVKDVTGDFTLVTKKILSRYTNMRYANGKNTDINTLLYGIKVINAEVIR